MKSLTLTAVVVLAQAALAPPVTAQTTSPAPPAPVSFPASDTSQPADASQPADQLPPEELEQILGPIALYPDVLLAQILPASTFPMDIVQAARWLRSKPDMSKLLDQKWDPSVLALCNYPEVIYMLDKDLDWTNALGAAFLSQQEDVMSTIQDLRRKAQANGALQTTPQQTVVADEGAVRIVPTQEDVIYVPQYDPQVVFYQPAPTVVVQEPGVSAGAAVAASAISFGTGLALGAWLNHDCDWGGHGVVWCQPGYWGGWGHVGAVHYNAGRWGAYGPRGGAYVGPHGAAVWGNNGHGAAWRRPTTSGRPSYTGRYSSYNRVGGVNTQVNRNRVTAGNQVNINRNNVNVDRGDRTNIARGDNRTTVGGVNRTNVQGGNRTSAFNSGNRTSQVQRDSQRGNASRTQAGARAQAPRTTGGKASSFNDTRSRSQVKQSSNRGSASRGGGSASRGGGGGGGRGGGGRGGGGRGGGGRR